MRFGKLAVMTAAMALVAACGQAEVDEFAEAAPEIEELALEIAGGAAEGMVAQEQASAADLEQLKQALNGEPPEFLVRAKEQVRQLNVAVRRAVAPLLRLVRETAPTLETGEARVYGPRDEGNVTWRLTIRKLGEKHFGWRLEGKPLGGEDSAYVVVVAGEVQRGLLRRGDAAGGTDQPSDGEAVRQGRGRIGIHLHNLKSIDASFPGQGQLLAGFAHMGRAKTLSYRLREFTPDVAAHEPVTAAFSGHRLPSGASAIRLVGRYNLERSPTEAKELVMTRARWMPEVGGRADIVATGGDVREGTAYLGTACWNTQEQTGYRVLRHCVRGVGCEVVYEEGARTSCSREVDQEPPHDGWRPDDGAVEADAPFTDVAAPVDFPTGGR